MVERHRRPTLAAMPTTTTITLEIALEAVEAEAGVEIVAAEVEEADEDVSREKNTLSSD